MGRRVVGASEGQFRDEIGTAPVPPQSPIARALPLKIIAWRSSQTQRAGLIRAFRLRWHLRGIVRRCAVAHKAEKVWRRALQGENERLREQLRLSFGYLRFSCVVKAAELEVREKWRGMGQEEKAMWCRVARSET